MGRGLAGNERVNVSLCCYTRLCSWASLIVCPFKIGNENFPGLGTSVEDRTNVLCVWDASNLPLRGTDDPGWQFSSDLYLVKNQNFATGTQNCSKLVQQSDFWVAVQMSVLVESESKVYKNLMSLVQCES